MDEFIFKKDEEFLKIDTINNKVEIQLTVEKEVEDGVFLISIPSLNIHFYIIEEEKNINSENNKIKESITSFLNFFTKNKKGIYPLIEKMDQLGFNIQTKSSQSKIKNHDKKERVITSNYNQSFELTL